MKELKYFAIILFFILSLSCTVGFSQTSLSVGDIAIIGVNSDADDEFTLLLLKDISAGTSFYITDKGWNDGTGFQTIAGDGIWLWTSASAMSAGATIHIKTTNNGVIEAGSLAATPGTVSWVENNGTVISYTGDQVFIYQGTAASPTFITGCTWNVEAASTAGNWDGVATSATTSALPDQLTTGVNAIWLYGPGPTEYDNFRYKCSVLTSGTPTTLRAAICNISNWDIDLTNATAYTINPFPCSFTVSNPCVNPTVPTVTASPAAICPSSLSTFTITGTLNDATAWIIYTGSCGGTLLGTTASTSFSVSPSTTTTYYVRGEGGCVSPGSCGTTTVSVKPNYNLNETDYVCSGDSYTFPDGTTQNNITIQIVHNSNLQTVLLCDSIIQTTVNVWPTYNQNQTVYVCSGDSFTFPDGTTQSNITAQVIYTSNLLTTHSCDSIIVTTVNIWPVYNLNNTDYVCFGDSYTFPDGSTQNNITAQVIHTSNLLTTHLCDSIIVTTVNVWPVYNFNETDYVCSGESYTFPDGTTQNNITAQVIHSSNLLTTHLCDSIIVTTVNVYPVYNLSETEYVCSGSSYTFHDGTTINNITAQAVHTSSFQTIHSCDSIIVTTVNVYPVYNLNETDYVCSGDSYTFPDGTTQSNITSQVIYTSNLQTTHSCDSIIVTTVNVNPVYNFSETVYVCPYGIYTCPDGTVLSDITAQIIHTSNLQTAATLCDSIIVSTINVNPVYNLSETVYVCPNGDYTFPDGSTQTNISSQIVYTSNLQTVGTLCDSTIVTTVNVNPVYNLSETVYVCSGDDYTFPDGTTQTEIASQLIYTSNLQTVGTLCDSTIITTVNVNPVYNLAESFTICEGEDYTFPDGTTITNIVSQLIYISNLQTVATLCDSIIETTINVNPVYNLAETVYICPGESYTFPDGTTQNNITAELVHNSVFQMSGTLCDSIIATTVLLNPVYNLSETDYVCSGESYTFPDGFVQENITEQFVHTSTFETIGALCDSIIVTTVNVTAVDVSVTQNLHVLTANAVSAEYQWLDCNNGNNPIDGETDQVFTATSNGNYAVELTQNGCVDISDCYNVTTIQISDNGIANNIRVYPNPSNGLINIDMGNVCREVKVRISDVLGQIILERVYSSEQIISLQFDEAPGVYLMKVTFDDKETSIRVVKE